MGDSFMQTFEKALEERDQKAVKTALEWAAQVVEEMDTRKHSGSDLKRVAAKIRAGE